MNPTLVRYGVLYGILGVAVVGSTLALSQRPGDYAFFDPIIDVKSVIAQKFVREPDDAAMQRAAINGMIESLDDPYTVYVPPAERRDFTKDLTGEYVGIGALVNTQTGWLTIVSPLEDSPAFKAGLLADDKVLEADGKSTQGLSTDECVDLLSGEPGTPVQLLIERGGETLTVAVVRDRITTRTVKGFERDPSDPNRWQHMLDPDRKIAYIRITQFQQTTTMELAGALASVGASVDASDTLGGLILDLRFDPGGLLAEAIGVSDLFLREGVIVSTKGRARDEEIARASDPGTVPDFPMIVLVNGQSASASEIVAGALADNGRAKILGTRSFGKGSVQTVVPLPRGEGAQLKITEGFYYLPSGRCLHRLDDSVVWGVDPSPGMWIPMTNAQTGEMLRVRREQEVIHSPAAAGAASESRWSDPDWIVERLKDPQLAAGLRAMQGKVDSGEYPVVGEPEPEGREQISAELTRLDGARESLLRELSHLDERMDALESAGGQDALKPREPLWADGLDLTGGRLLVKDKDGNVIVELEITGNDVERWIAGADVKPPETPDKKP